MIKRRDFIIRAAAALTTAISLVSPVQALPPRPLRAGPHLRTLFAGLRQNGTYLLVSDGSPVPRRLIRRSAIERVFGSDNNTLQTAMKAYAQFERQSSLQHYQNSLQTARRGGAG